MNIQLDERIEAARRNLQNAPDETKWQNWRLLRELLQQRIELFNYLQDRDERICNDIRYLFRSPADTSDLSSVAFKLAVLAQDLDRRLTVTKSNIDNARVIFLRRFALSVIPQKQDRAIVTLQNALATNLSLKAETSLDVNTINEACELAEAAFGFDTSPQSLNYHQRIHTLNCVIGQRYKQLEHINDLHRWISVTKLEISTIPDPTLGAFQNMAQALNARYDLYGRIEDLGNAIGYGTRALEHPDTVSNRFIHLTINLATYLGSRYRRLKEEYDLQRAKDILDHAFERVEKHGSLFAELAQNKSYLYLVAYGVKCELQDIRSGLQCAKEGLCCGNMQCSTRRGLHENLGNLFKHMFQRTDVEFHKLQAISHFQSALELSVNDADRSGIWIAMGGVLETSFFVTKNIEDLKEAYNLGQMAIKHASIRHERIAWLNTANRCVTLAKLGPKDSRNQYLKNGIHFINVALDGIRKVQTDFEARVYTTAARLYSLRYQKFGIPEDFTMTLTLCFETWENEAIIFHRRLAAVETMCELWIRANYWSNAWKILQVATKLTSIYCATHLEEADRQWMITELPSITATACTAGLVLGEIEKSLLIWEQGRELIVSLSHRASADLLRLRKVYPSLYRKFQRQRALVFEVDEGSQLSFTLSNNSSILQNNRHSASVRLTEIIDEIQVNCPGFENFLRPLDCAAMQSLAKEGVITVLNSSKFGAHAIIVTATKLDCIKIESPPQMPEFFTNGEGVIGMMISKWIKRSGGAGLDETGRNNSLGGFLQTLWRWAIRPVCESIGFTAEFRAECLTRRPLKIGACRIRWLTNGIFSQMPIHAAGDWAGPGHESLPSRAISSYATSFRMLDYANELSKRVKTVKLEGLITTMQRPSPGFPGGEKKFFLQRAEKTADEIKSAGPNFHWNIQHRQSAAKVLEEIPNYPFVHFIAHGVTHASNPMKSHLVFLKMAASKPDSNASGDNLTATPDPLSVEDISQRTGDNTVLAFLAACNTAQVQPIKLQEENLHIINALQQAGFPHVIGSLWATNEISSSLFAKKFYQTLSENIPINSDIDDINDIIALSYWICSHFLWMRYRYQFRLWTCFVYTGP